jgi:phosphopantothenoylcysteine decarboxylase
MNTFMYTHPITAKQLKVVTEELGYKVIGPQGSKGLACGDIGSSFLGISRIVALFRSTLTDLRRIRGRCNDRMDRDCRRNQAMRDSAK